MSALRAVSRVFRRMGANQRTAAEYFEGMMRPFDFSRIRPVLAYLNLITGTCRWWWAGGASNSSKSVRRTLQETWWSICPRSGFFLQEIFCFHGVVPVLWDGSPV